MLFNQDKIILDLCGGTGAWSKDYKEAGYDVRVITFPPDDVRLFEKPKEHVYGILAAPPCNHFSVSGAQYWKEKDDDGRTLDGISIMDSCIRIIFVCDPVFWCLENPVGRMKYYLGNPVMSFNPCDYGDAYTKKTLLWGKFNKPKTNYIEPVSNSNQENLISTPVLNGKKVGWNTPECKMLRSITPPGFARAFFEANR